MVYSAQRMLLLDTRGHELYWCWRGPAKIFRILNLAVLAQFTHQQQVWAHVLFFAIKLSHFMSVA